jgi:hypothetical protein
MTTVQDNTPSTTEDARSAVIRSLAHMAFGALQASFPHRDSPCHSNLSHTIIRGNTLRITSLSGCPTTEDCESAILFFATKHWNVLREEAPHVEVKKSEFSVEDSVAYRASSSSLETGKLHIYGFCDGEGKSVDITVM